MSGTSKKLRALLLATIMVTSVFAGGLAGAATAQNGNAGNGNAQLGNGNGNTALPSGPASGDNTDPATVTFSERVEVADLEFDNAGDVQDVTVDVVDSGNGASASVDDVSEVTVELTTEADETFTKTADYDANDITLDFSTEVSGADVINDVEIVRVFARTSGNPTDGAELDAVVDLQVNPTTTIDTQNVQTIITDPTGFIAGDVRNSATSNPVPNAPVEIYRASQTPASSTPIKTVNTTQSGDYTVELVPSSEPNAEEYQVVVDLDFFETFASSSLPVTDGETTTQDVTLVPEVVPTDVEVVAVDPSSANAPADDESTITYFVQVTGREGGTTGVPVNGADLTATDNGDEVVFVDGNQPAQNTTQETTLPDGTTIDGVTTFSVRSPLSQTAQLNFSVVQNESAFTIADANFGVLRGEGTVPGQVFDLSTTSGLDEATAYAVESTRYRRNTIHGAIDVTEGDTVFLRVSRVNGTTGEVIERLDNYEYEVEVGPDTIPSDGFPDTLPLGADPVEGVTDVEDLTDVENSGSTGVGVPDLSIIPGTLTPGSLYEYLAEYGQLEEDNSVGANPYKTFGQDEQVGLLDNLNTTDDGVGSGFFAKDRDGDGDVAFLVTPLEPGNYTIEVSDKQTSASRERFASAGTGPDDSFQTIPETFANDDEGFEFGDAGAGTFSPDVYLTENVTVKDAQERSNESGPVLFDETDSDGDYLLNQLYGNGQAGEMYTIVAEKGGYDRDFADVFVREDGHTYEDENDEVLEIEPVDVTPVVNITNIAQLPNASAELAGPANETASYEPYAFNNQTDDFTQVIPRNGQTVDVVLVETEGENTDAPTSATVTLSVPDQLNDSTAADNENFNGEFIAVAGGQTVAEDEVSNTITVETGNDGQAVVWLQADRSSDTLDKVDVDSDSAFADLTGPTDQFSGIRAQVTTNTEAVDQTNKSFAGITQFGSISGIVTDERNDPIANADVLLSQFELKDNSAEVRIEGTSTPDEVRISIYDDEVSEDLGTVSNSDPASSRLVDSAVVDLTELDNNQQPGEDARNATGYFFEDFNNSVRQQYGLLPPEPDTGFTLYAVSSTSADGKYTLPRVPAKATNNEYLVRGETRAGAVGFSDAETRANVTDDANIVIPGALLPDFRVEGLNAPAQAELGSSITVTAQVRNEGDVTGDANVEFRLDLNQDGQLTRNETLRTQTVQAIDSGTARPVAFNVPTAALAPDTTYEHGVFVVQSDGSAVDSQTAQIEITAAGDGSPSGFSVSDYANANSVVDASGLSQAVGEWAAGDITTSQLSQVIDAWATGTPVN